MVQTTLSGPPSVLAVLDADEGQAREQGRAKAPGEPRLSKRCWICGSKAVSVALVSLGLKMGSGMQKKQAAAMAGIVSGSIGMEGRWSAPKGE